MALRRLNMNKDTRKRIRQALSSLLEINFQRSLVFCSTIFGTGLNKFLVSSKKFGLGLRPSYLYNHELIA